MEKPDTKKGTRRKRDQTPTKRLPKNSYNSNGQSTMHVVGVLNIYNGNSATAKTQKRKREEIEKEEKEPKIAEERERNAKRKQDKADEEKEKKLQRKRQKTILKEEGEELKAKLNITKAYNELSSENKDISLKACKTILKNVVEKVEGERKESKSKKYDFIENLTFPGVQTKSDAIVEEIFKWYNELLKDGSYAAYEQREFLMGIFSKVIGRSAVKKIFIDNVRADYKAKYKLLTEATMYADNSLMADY